MQHTIITRCQQLAAVTMSLCSTQEVRNKTYQVTHIHRGFFQFKCWISSDIAMELQDIKGILLFVLLLNCFRPCFREGKSSCFFNLCLLYFKLLYLTVLLMNWIVHFYDEVFVKIVVFVWTWLSTRVEWNDTFEPFSKMVTTLSIRYIFMSLIPNKCWYFDRRWSFFILVYISGCTWLIASTISPWLGHSYSLVYCSADQNQNHWINGAGSVSVSGLKPKQWNGMCQLQLYTYFVYYTLHCFWLLL